MPTTGSSDMAGEDQIFAGDLSVGTEWQGPTRRLTQEDFAAFAKLTGDDHPIHYDADYAARTRFGRPVAHGLLLMGLTALGAAPVSARLRDSMVALVSQSADFLAPVMAGDTVTCSFSCSAVTPTRRAGQRRVTIDVTLTRQDGTRVLSGRHVYLLLTARSEGHSS